MTPNFHPAAGKAHAGGAVRRGSMRYLSLSAAFCACFACPAWAAKWEIVPSLTIQETYSDNLSLSSDASKVSDFVTQVIPGISIAATGARLKFRLDYAPEITYYAKEEANSQTYQRLNAFGSAEVLKQLVFFDAGAAINQYNVSLQGPLTNSNIYTTGNRASVFTYFASPYIQHEFAGSDIKALLRYTYSVADSDEQFGFSDSVSDRFNFRLGSGGARKILTWDLAYTKEIIRYEQSLLDTTSEISLLTVRRLITPTLGLLASGGYETYSHTVGPSSDGPSWSAGIDWEPSPRTRLIATGGERFYGNTYFLDFRHRTGLTAWNAGYSENVTTTRNEFFIPAVSSTAAYLDTLFATRFPDPAARQKAVEDFIARTGLPPSLNSPFNFFTDQLFLEKGWRASASIMGVRNLVIASVFGMTREAIVGDLILPTTPNSNIQTGTSILWNWRLTPWRSWNTIVAYTRNESPSTGEIEHITYAQMGFSRQFQPRLSGALSYRRQQNDSNLSASNYTENAVIGTLQMRF